MVRIRRIEMALLFETRGKRALSVEGGSVHRWESLNRCIIFFELFLSIANITLQMISKRSAEVFVSDALNNSSFECFASSYAFEKKAF